MTQNRQIQQRIDTLQNSMKSKDVHAWIILSSDPHLSEYLPDHWKLRQFLSGFTGSAGTLLVTQESAYLWADSRYWVQAEKELAGTGVHLQKLGAPETPSLLQFLTDKLPEKSVVTILGNTVPISLFITLFNGLKENNIFLTTESDPFDELYPNRPDLPQSAIYRHDPQFVSLSTNEKLGQIRQAMAERQVDYHLISTLDDIAWVTNLRGSDVEYNPIFLAYLLITPTQATLFIDQSRVDDAISDYLYEEGIALQSYQSIANYIGDIPEEAKVLLDPDRTTYDSLERLPKSCTILYHINPSTLMKACKSDHDITNIHEAMVNDGVALAHFFTQFEAKLAQNETVTELTVADMLEEERKKRPHFVSLSFGTIAGFNENGALPHYSATKEAHSTINGDGLLLIDSGAQYQNGTTDITRVIPIGTPSDAQKRDFTLTLKAMITMSCATFPDNIKMPLLDAIARAPLWNHQIDFGHGTGHGVGYFLNVHEGPQVLSYHAPVTEERAVRNGMITSIEPGIYREGKWGIRIENLVASRPVKSPEENDFGDYLYFETLTLCPIDTRLIDPQYLDQKEIDWLNAYHDTVYQRLSPHIEEEAVKTWLRERTQAI